MTKKIIIIDNRNAATLQERPLFGQTLTEDNVSHIFINARKNRSGRELVDTLYHEFTHAMIGLYRTRITPSQEEKLCKRIAKIAAVEFTNV